MIEALNKFQRILGIRLNENLKTYTKIPQKKMTCYFYYSHGTSF